MTSVDLNNLSIKEFKKLVKDEIKENKKLKEEKKFIKSCKNKTEN